jgi:hypothetical protein
MTDTERIVTTLPPDPEVPRDQKRLFGEWFVGNGPKVLRLKNSIKNQCKLLGADTASQLEEGAWEEVWRVLKLAQKNPDKATSPGERMLIVAAAKAVGGNDRIVEDLCWGSDIGLKDRYSLLGVVHLVRADQKQKTFSLTNTDAAYEFEAGTYFLARRLTFPG